MSIEAFRKIQIGNEVLKSTTGEGNVADPDRLTEVANFTNAKVGDLIRITGGTGVTAGLYTVAVVVSADAIDLSSVFITAGTPTDIAYTLQTRGAAVAANKVLIGSITMTPSISWHRPADERGSLAEFSRAIKVAQGCALRYEGDASYDQLIYFLAMALKGGQAPAGPGGDGDYTWTFEPTMIAKVVPDSFTFEYGDDSQVWESPFVICSNLELSIAMNEVVALRADLFGQFPTKTSFTSLGANLPTNLHEIVTAALKVYINTTWATLGDTEKAALVAGGTIRLATGFKPVKYADGSYDFSAIVEQRRHLEIDLDLIVGADAITEYDAWVAGTTRAIRLEFTGPIIAGTTPYKLTVNAVGKYTSEPTIFGLRDGENLLSLTFSSHEIYEAAAREELSIVVVNVETAL